MSISTSAIIFSKYIESGLKNSDYILHISPDAGTEETYSRIKGQSAFKIVWENIGRYCQLSDKVFVRYILSSMNSSRKEIDAFVNMCVKHKVKNVVISSEHEAAREISDRIHWEYGKAEYKANAYIVTECMRHGFATFLYLTGMSEKNEENVLETFVEEGLNGLLHKDKLFVFGIGKNGKRLIKILLEHGAIISGFIDNYVQAEVKNYCGIPRVSYNDVNKEKDVILITPDKYQEIELELFSLGYKNVYKLYLG